IVHGHGADTESPVSLAFEIQPGAIGLTYEDMARPYDPFARVRVPDAALGVEEQPVGGLGVVLVAAIAERVEYAYVRGKNRNALAWHESLTDDVALEMTPWEMKKPVIASVQGHCLGGGCELAMMCDLTIAADDALFGEPEIRFSNVGPALVMPFVIGLKRARELLFLGDPIDAQTALQYGMVNRVVPRAGLATATLKFARRMALISP